jgi:hypothetical protein
MSAARFESLTYSVSPIIRAVTTEMEFYSNDAESVLGTVILDGTDGDWSWVIPGRDTDGLFKAVDCKASIDLRVQARTALHEAMDKLTATGQHVFPQDPLQKKTQLLQPIVPPERLHPNFRKLIELDGYSSARGIMQEIAYAFVDIDGNYIKDFQTTGFAARLWKLYLFAFLHEQRFILNTMGRTHTLDRQASIPRVL